MKGQTTKKELETFSTSNQIHLFNIVTHARILEAINTDKEIMQIALETIDILFDNATTNEAKAKLEQCRDAIKSLLADLESMTDYIHLQQIRYKTGAKPV